MTLKDKKEENLLKIYRQLKIGNYIKLKTTIRKAKNSRNPGEFDYYNYLLKKEITSLGFVKSAQDVIIVNYNSNLFNLVFEIRKIIDEKLRLTNEKNSYALLRGLILADRSLIDQEDKNSFINSGVIHVLAVSGLHVGFIAIIFYALFSRFHLRIRSCLTILGLIFFLILTGGQPSVFRATIMGIIVIYSTISGRSKDIFNGLAVAALIILIANPNELFHPGFQLSFSAVISIVVFTGKFQKIFFKIKTPKFIKAILALVFVSVAAQIGTLPFTLFYFNKLSIVSIFINTIVVPAIGVILGVGIMGLFLSFINLELASFYNITNEFLVKYLVEMIKFSSEMKFSYLSIYGFSIYDSLLFFIFLGLSFLFLKKFNSLKNKIILSLVILFAVWQCFLVDNAELLPENNLSVCAIDVGQGDAILIKFPNGKTALIDAGNATPNFDNGEKVIIPLLKNLGIDKLDYAFISHLDSDHYKGSLSLIKEGLIKKVFKPPIDSTLKKDQKFEQFLRSNNVGFSYYQKEILDIGECRLYFLADTKSEIYNSFDVNNKSGIIKLVYGKNSFLFVGDAEEEMESFLAESYREFLKSDYLKVSHHGSKTGSIPEFLRFVQPTIALISAGIDNKFKHPSDEVISRLDKLNAEIFRTDKNGAVIFTSDGNKITRIYWRD